MVNPKALEKQEQRTVKKSKLEEIVKIRTEINEAKIQEMNETNSWDFEKINKIDKPEAKLTKREKEFN